jgi:hypothetical protein
MYLMQAQIPWGGQPRQALSNQIQLVQDNSLLHRQLSRGPILSYDPCLPFRILVSVPLDLVTQ